MKGKGFWELGFKNYQEYLNSYLWKNKSDFLIANTIKCNICKCRVIKGKKYIEDSHGNITKTIKSYLQVHHLNYDNIPQEKSEDLIVICKQCHEYIHKK